MVGRRSEIAGVKRLLADSRLVTLTGTGGVGKTRLALQVARDVRRAFRDGVFWVSLAEVGESDQVVLTVMDAVGMRTMGPDAARALTRHLRDKRLLLVLDNCEHLVEACGEAAADLLAMCPGVRVLATSREVLDIAGERVFAVPPLPVPLETSPGSHGGIRADSVALFVDRAAAAAPGFEVTPDNEQAVAALCRHLEGLPLAIELAAARVRSLSVEELVRRQDERYELLTRRRRRGSAFRHRSLRSTVDWSFELCSPEERLLWARLSVFAGGCDLTAAQNVCSDRKLTREAVLEAVAGLVEKSILTREEVHGRVRYRMLETLRQYGREHLARAGETDGLRRRHRDHYLQLAEHVHDQWFGPGQVILFASARREHANLRAALEYCLTEPGEAPHALRMAASLWTYWIVCGLVQEGAIWLARALAGSPAPGPHRVDALWAASLVSNYSGDRGRPAERAALAMIEECHRLATSLRDPARIAHATYLWGYMQLLGEDPVRGFLVLGEGVELERALGEPNPHLRHAQLLLAIAGSLADLDHVVRTVGEECRTACRDAGEQWLQSWSLLYLGLSAVIQGRCEDAEAYLRGAVRLQHPFRQPLGVGCALEYLAWSAVKSGDPDRGARLFGAGTVFLEPLGLDFGNLTREQWVERGDRSGIVRTAVDALGERAYRLAYQSGARLTQDEAVAYALGIRETTSRNTVQVPKRPEVLTRRERQIAELLAEGKSNRDIAEQLVISQRTAETHVANILSKLACTSRAQVATVITGQNLTGHLPEQDDQNPAAAK
ncbi:LuxR C-terminal-related transcriptional regulator [Streptomyces sp. NBC_00273]|uniref:LuxR C-terminal-related transcriptional regulator n=1 Tax=Streptomyces sp. NBC_00273 TaxID=2903644 RepID=UPI002E2BC0F4|nr:LuxR C-terminal-related transcriptional regulator [Streptomyces sp. NBC_00273]